MQNPAQKRAPPPPAAPPPANISRSGRIPPPKGSPPPNGVRRPKPRVQRRRTADQHLREDHNRERIGSVERDLGLLGNSRHWSDEEPQGFVRWKLVLLLTRRRTVDPFGIVRGHLIRTESI